MNFCELEEIKEWLGIEKENTSKNLILNIYAEGITETILGMIGREIFSKNYTEKYAGTDTNSLVLKHNPVNFIKSIKYIENEKVIATLNENEYELNEKAGILYKELAWWKIGGSNLMSGRMCFPRRHIRVEYNAGYEKIPADLKMLFLQLLKSQIEFDKSKAGQGLKSYSISDIKLEWKSEIRLSKQQQNIINKYRGVRF